VQIAHRRAPPFSSFLQRGYMAPPGPPPSGCLPFCSPLSMQIPFPPLQILKNFYPFFVWRFPWGLLRKIVCFPPGHQVSNGVQLIFGVVHRVAFCFFFFFHPVGGKPRLVAFSPRCVSRLFFLFLPKPPVLTPCLDQLGFLVRAGFALQHRAPLPPRFSVEPDLEEALESWFFPPDCFCMDVTFFHLFMTVFGTPLPSPTGGLGPNLPVRTISLSTPATSGDEPPRDSFCLAQSHPSKHLSRGGQFLYGWTLFLRESFTVEPVYR